MSDPVHVISLRRTPERLSAFAALNAHLAFQGIEAVDGQSLTAGDLAACGLFAPGLPYSPGACGCAMSHVRLWDQAVAANRPVTVAEDDAIFRLDFHAQQERLLAQAPDGWDLILWGWNFDAAMALRVLPGVSPVVVCCDQGLMRESTEAFQALGEPASLLRLDKWWGLPAYTISPRGAARFKRLCLPLKNFAFESPMLPRPMPNSGIDAAMAAVSPLTQAYVSMPPLVVTPNRNEASTTLHPARTVPLSPSVPAAG